MTPTQEVAKVTIKRYKRGTGIYIKGSVKAPLTILEIRTLAKVLAENLKAAIKGEL